MSTHVSIVLLDEEVEDKEEKIHATTCNNSEVIWSGFS